MEQNIDKRMVEAIGLAKIGFYSYMFDGTILSIDQVAFDFFELEGIFKDPQSLIGNNIESMLIYTGAKGKLREEIRLKKRVMRLEYGLKTIRGTEKWGVHNSYLFIDEKTGKEAIQVCFYDITERRKHEEEKIGLENRLRQSEKLQAIGQLAGGIAHDFNNQLTGIVGYADLLRYELRDNIELSHYVDNILIASKHSADLTKQLLAFARKGNYMTVEVDIHRTISEVISLLQHSIDKRIEIQQILKANPPIVNGDPTQLQNALLNIALNARDAIPDGGVISFETKIVDFKDLCSKLRADKSHPGKFIEISIKDNGIGMTKEILDRIFEPFFTTKEVGEGTGMGLAAVFGTVESHKGYIDVVSEISKGSSFEIYLPIDNSTDKIYAQDAEPIIFNKKLKILLVDDEDMVRSLGKEMLEIKGHSVLVCKDGLEAVELYEKNWQDIDLVILDMVMPKLGGTDTFHAMKEINPNFKVLLSSGYSITGEAQNLLDKGAQGFIQKPFTIEELTQSIAKIFPYGSLSQNV